MAKSELEMGAEIMQMVNEVTDSKRARMIKTIEQQAGATPDYLVIRSIMPLDMTVGFMNELAAYKYGFAMRNHFTSDVKIEIAGGPALPGAFLVVLTPKKQ